MRQKAGQLGIAEQVLFCGQMADVSPWYQAMDCFVLPSLFEGLPVVGIEAQAAGLPCLFSDRVTDEVLIMPDAGRLALEEDNAVWSSRILQLRGERDRRAGEQAVREAGYDIEREAVLLQNRYLEMTERR